MPVGIVQVFIVIGGGGLVGVVARQRGRSFVLWAAIATLLSAVVYVVAITGTSGSVGYARSGVAGAFALLVAPAFPHLCLGALLKAMGYRTSSNSWKVTPVGESGGPGKLQIRGGDLLLSSSQGAATRIPLARLESVRPDCECVRLAWDDGGESRELVLQINLNGAEWEARAALADAAARTIDAARRGAGGLPTARAL